MKEKLMQCIDLAQEEKVAVYVKVRMPGCAGLEMIINPPENLTYKKAYYEDSYTDDLHLKTYSKIQIVEFGHIQGSF